MSRRDRKFNSEALKKEINVGAMIDQYLRKNKIAKSAIARVMKRDPSTLASFLKRPSIQVAVLWEFSNAVYYNFFADLAAKIPAHWPPHTNTSADKDTEIAALKAEIEKLKTEKELLLAVLKK